MLKRLTCPSCSAHLVPPGSAAQVTCSYCGTTSTIERAGTKLPPGVQVAQYKMPRWAYLIYAVPFLGVAVSLGGAVFGILSGQPVGLAGIVQWDPQTHFELREITGDTTPDIIGRVRTFEGSESVLNYAAFDGQGGRQLWITPSLGDLASESTSIARVAGETLVVSNSRGQLHGFTLADGSPRWTVSLGERVKYICASTAKEATVVTVDEVSRILNLTDGTFRPSPTDEMPEGCEMPQKTDKIYGSESGTRWPSTDAEDGLKTPPGTKLASVFSGPDGYQVALGVKSPGSAVPLVVVFQGGTLRWSGVIPEGNPLAAATGPAELALIQDGILVVSYELLNSDSGRRLSGRDLESGKLLWDVQIPHSTEVSADPSRLTADDTKIYIPHWTWLEVMDLHSGEHLYTIGRWRA